VKNNRDGKVMKNMLFGKGRGGLYGLKCNRGAFKQEEFVIMFVWGF
jgi:hypothetical protein